MSIKKCIITAAGLGTRFLPFTKSIAKEMLPIIDRPNIEYLIREAKNSGIEEVIIIVSKSKPEIEDYYLHLNQYDFDKHRICSWNGYYRTIRACDREHCQS